MKKIITFLIIVIVTPLYSQWTLLNSGTSEFLNDVYCITENFVVVVGDNGTILKTTDGGNTWITKVSGTNLDLQKVQFYGANIGYISGNNNANGILLKTTDGGENWTSVPAAGVSRIYDFSLVDESVIFISGANDTFKKSSDGAISFQTIITNTFPRRIQFFNEQNGYGCNGAFLLKTTNGGINWQKLTDMDAYPADGAFYFVNEQVGFVNTSTSLSRTTDGGQTFDYLDSIDYNMFRLFAPTENVVWGCTWVRVFGSPTDQTMLGLITAAGDFERIDSDDILKSIHFANETIGFAVTNERIYKNTSGTLSNINHDKNEVSFGVSPNPASDEITISLKGIKSPSFTIRITDSLGKEVYFEKFTSTDQVEIDTKILERGIYFVTLMTTELKQTRKLIIR